MSCTAITKSSSPPSPVEISEIPIPTTKASGASAHPLADRVTPPTIRISFSPSWDADTKLQNLTSLQKKHLKDLWNIFKSSFGMHCIRPVDLRNNVDFDKTGILRIQSLRNRVKEANCFAFCSIAESNLQAYANKNHEIYQYLLSSVLFSGSMIGTETYKTLNKDPCQKVILFDDDFNKTELDPI